MTPSEDYIVKQFQKIRERMEALSDHQKKLWCLLSLCRTKQCFLLLSGLDICRGLSRFDELLDAVRGGICLAHSDSIDAFRRFITILEAALDGCSGMYWDEDLQDLRELPPERDSSHADLGEGFSPFMFFDLIASIVEFLAHFSDLDSLGGRKNLCCAEIVLGATFETYFYQKYQTENLADVKEVTVEVQRVWNDYHYILSNPRQSEIDRKIQEYKNICVWKQKHLHHHENAKAVINRMNRAIGHMEAVRNMIEHDRPCSEVLIQIAAVRSAVNNIGKIILEDYVSRCVADAIETGDDLSLQELNDAISKFVK